MNETNTNLLDGDESDTDSAEQFGPPEPETDAHFEREDLAPETADAPAVEPKTPAPAKQIPNEATASPATTPGFSARKPGASSYPKPLKPFVESGCITAEKMAEIAGSAYVTFEDDQEQIPLSWLLPDFYQQVRRRAGKKRGGHVCGELFTGDEGFKTYFAFNVPAPEGQAAPSAETERIDRLEGLFEQMAERMLNAPSAEPVNRLDVIRDFLSGDREENKLRREFQKRLMADAPKPAEPTETKREPTDEEVEEAAEGMMDKISNVLDSMAAVADTPVGEKVGELLGRLIPKEEVKKGDVTIEK